MKRMRFLEKVANPIITLEGGFKGMAAWRLSVVHTWITSDSFVHNVGGEERVKGISSKILKGGEEEEEIYS